MKTFIFYANCTFEAENIDDAFLKLRDHFDALLGDEDGIIEGKDLHLETGEMHIHPEGDGK